MHLNSRLAASRAVTSIVMAMKWANFVGLLTTTTRMASLLQDLGSPVMRLSEMLLNRLAGISSGHRNPSAIRSLLEFSKPDSVIWRACGIKAPASSWQSVVGAP